LPSYGHYDVIVHEGQFGHRNNAPTGLDLGTLVAVHLLTGEEILATSALITVSAVITVKA
jgi:hypothetical protein